MYYVWQTGVEKLTPGLSPSPLPTATPLPSPTPTPSPLTFAQMNELYGPCTFLPTLMYHHVQNLDQAKAENHLTLTVANTTFREHLQYLRDKGYNIVSMQQLINFFDTGAPLPGRAMLLTFDDAYTDFGSTAFPILREFDYQATVFVPTGLVDNPGYLSWNSINDMKGSGLILFSNHTWSHQNVYAANSVVEKEISTADTQLRDHGQNNPKVFAYPYGGADNFAISYLANSGYSLAFTTNPGSTLCKQLRFALPRIRVGNISLAAYGF